MKVISFILVLIISTYLGFLFGKKYKDKKEFFRDYQHFINFTKSQIGYSSLKIKDILNNAKTIIKNKNILLLIDIFNSALSNDRKIVVDDLHIFNFLNSSEKNEIVICLNKLGTTDIFDQKEHLANHIDIINKMYEKANSECDKYLPLYTKLGLLLGLFVIVILV